jgi:hypothetical protein
MSVPSMAYPVAMAICVLAVFILFGLFDTWRYDKHEAALESGPAANGTRCTGTCPLGFCRPCE